LSNTVGQAAQQKYRNKQSSTVQGHGKLTSRFHSVARRCVDRMTVDGAAGIEPR
jgi:hypothetical protein